MPTDLPAREATRTFQSRLPRLPVPDLALTAERYLESLKPLLNAKDLARNQRLVADFIKPQGEGEVLQRLLLDYARTQSTSWLDTWWLECAYLAWREPVVINSNYYIVARDDPRQPPFQPPGRLLGPRPSGPVNPSTGAPKGTFTPFQIRRTAHIIHEMVNYMEGLEQGDIPVDKTRQGPQCMSQYYAYFGTCRVPAPGCDRVRRTPTDAVRHIVVLTKDQVYEVPVYARGPDRVRLTKGDLEEQIWQVVHLAETSPLDAPVPVLTADHRDAWAENYAYLKQLNRTNAESLDKIETALFAVSLDDYSTGDDYSRNVANMMAGRDGHNRWFDKTSTIIIESSGRAGWNGEHTPCDALIPCFAYDYALNIPTRWPEPFMTSSVPRDGPRHLHFYTDDRVHAMIRSAQACVSAIVKDSHPVAYQFTGYGTDFIKRVARLAPDAYVQMAIQLAYYRLHGGQYTPTYETGGTRKFLHGRTETIRVLTTEVVEFLRAMGTGGGGVKEGSNGDQPKPSAIKAVDKYRRLQKAVGRHVELSILAADGQGVDRHLLGLKLAHHRLRPQSAPSHTNHLPASAATTTATMPLHPIFTDPAYTDSSTWRLSTSSIHEGYNFVASGFGAVVPDGGYGMNYMKEPGQIKFGLEAKKSGPADVVGLSKALEQAFLDMGELCQDESVKEAQRATTKAKL